MTDTPAPIATTEGTAETADWLRDELRNARGFGEKRYVRIRQDQAELFLRLLVALASSNAEIERLKAERDEAREIAACFTQVEKYTGMKQRAEAAESLAATARRDAFEEAAKVADEYAMRFSYGPVDQAAMTAATNYAHNLVAMVSKSAAAAIRSLATVPGGEGKPPD